MNFETAKNYYITRSRQVINANEALAKESFGLFEIITRTKLKAYKSKLSSYYDWLREYDDTYGESLSVQGTINELQMRQAKVAIAANARNFLVSSIGGGTRKN